MSRSFKKHPYQANTEGNCCRKFSKNRANKRVRKSEDLPNGKAYKKVFETWDIVDYAWSDTWNERKRWLEKQGYDEIDWAKERNYWERHLYRK